MFSWYLLDSTVWRLLMIQICSCRSQKSYSWQEDEQTKSINCFFCSIEVNGNRFDCSWYEVLQANAFRNINTGEELLVDRDNSYVLP